MKSKSTRIVSFALTEKQFLELKARAQSEGCSLSDLIRRQLALRPNLPLAMETKKRQLGLALGALYADITAGVTPQAIGDRLREITQSLKKL